MIVKTPFDSDSSPESSRETSETMGGIMLLATKNTSWVMAMTKTIATVIAQKAPGAKEDVESAFAEGQVRAEMSCPCGECPPCMLRASKGDDAAKRELSEHFKPKRQSRIVNTNGRPMA